MASWRKSFREASSYLQYSLRAAEGQKISFHWLASLLLVDTYSSLLMLMKPYAYKALCTVSEIRHPIIILGKRWADFLTVGKQTCFAGGHAQRRQDLWSCAFHTGSLLHPLSLVLSLTLSHLDLPNSQQNNSPLLGFWIFSFNVCFWKMTFQKKKRLKSCFC